MLQSNTALDEECDIQFHNVSRLFDLERQRRANRCAEQDGMFRELDKVNTDISGAWLRAALLVSYVSIAITLILGSLYFVFSALDGSPAAFGFAFAAILDACSSAVVVWRFSGIAGQKYSFERERKACIIIGVCFVLSGSAIVSKAVYMLVIDNEPKRSTALLITTFATFGCMVLLAWFKYLIAYKVDSRALRTDAFNSTAEAVMAFVMAMSDLIYDQNPNIWFLDASAAIFIAFVLIVYGVRTIVELLLTKGLAPIPNK
ncbi:transmembrane protein 163-like isoform X1 [Orbicella faveolata]|uniref:transmembrane protein 163-like isoform X1 n=2 Tax=Orbicella faveolata TaxID=48498 RepID=UPI0009E64050|nr:transmembrane protein 163-like isoform X1 [Orbicella faveolata]